MLCTHYEMCGTHSGLSRFQEEEQHRLLLMSKREEHLNTLNENKTYLQVQLL